MVSLNLIMSGAYVERELVAEFGKLPPSFLPVGVGRLYDLQIDVIKRSLQVDEKIHLILPESYEISFYDRESLKRKDVSLLFVPDGMTLGEALLYAINMLTSFTSSVRVLHGDTVLDQLPVDFDSVVTHKDSDDYSWAIVKHTGGTVDSFSQIQASSDKTVSSPVACGFFSFSSSIDLVRSLIATRYDFLSALNKYNTIHNMKVVQTDSWYDFGHLQNYFHSRRLVTTARSFNAIKITKCSVEKSSTDQFKMSAEENWLTIIPSNIQPYAVRLFGSGVSCDGLKRFYSTDYQYAPNLAELFVFSKVGRLTWEKIFISCCDFLKECSKKHTTKLGRDYLAALVEQKTDERMEKYASSTGFDLDHTLRLNGSLFPSLREIASELKSFINFDNDAPATVMHGDFCFSNILYNSRNQRISVIDPRGYVFSDSAEIYGDIRYDIAKLSHSVNGFYDLIIAGRYSMSMKGGYDFSLNFEPSAVRDWLRRRFLRLEVAGISASSREVKAITALLFISMLPLHADRPDRQKAFIANSVRLYKDLRGE